MDELLFLSHRIPFPPNKGDKIRSWHMLDYLNQYYRVHLGCFIDDSDDWQYVEMLRDRCASLEVAALHPGRAKLRGGLGALTGAPISLGYFRDRALARWVRALADSGRVRRVFAYSSPMAQYVMGADWSGARRVFDFVDVDSDKWRQYAAAKRWPRGLVYAHEARALLRFERRAAAIADASLLVSDSEAALFRTLAPDSAEKIYGLSNGVDTSFFDPELGGESPYGVAPVIVFTGAMDYWANIDAVVWFAREILPVIRAGRGDAEFTIVGANPSAEVEALAALPGVTVTGRVTDVRPYIAHAAIAVAPLRLARGVQNKVLEAMAMAKCVVATPQALEGITAAPGRELAVATTAVEFAAAVLRHLDRSDTAEMGRAARALVVRDYGWHGHLTRLSALLEPALC